VPMNAWQHFPEFKTAGGGPTLRAQRSALATGGCASFGTSGTVDATSAPSRNRRSRPGRRAPIVGRFAGRLQSGLLGC
jgi:hypothetical protein